MLGTSSVFAASAVLEFMRGPWGLGVFIGGAVLLMAVGFAIMKMMDKKRSYEETYHPPR